MSANIDHDRLFKELLSTFFEEFILLFFPKVYEDLDFQNLRFLSEELVTDVTKGEKYRIDLLVETKLKGEEGLILIHLESQAQYQSTFNERMFVYFGRLYEKYRRKILPIALFSHDSMVEEPSHFSISFPSMQIINFHYLTVQLKKENWRNYIRQDNPVAAALLSKMGYTEREKIEVKTEFLGMLLRMQLDPERLTLILGFFAPEGKYNFPQGISATTPLSSPNGSPIGEFSLYVFIVKSRRGTKSLGRGESNECKRRRKSHGNYQFV